MEDIAPKLLEAITDTYSREAAKNQKIKDILAKIEKGEADYEDLLSYAKELGSCLETAFRVNVSEDVLPDGKMYYNIAERLINPVVKQNYILISKRCEEVQTALNKKAKLGLKGIRPAYNQEKTDSIIDYISSADTYSQREKSFLQSLSTNAKSVVDDSVRENAEFHYKSGLSPKIIRRTNGTSCKWCQSLAGVYDYSAVKDTGNNVFRRHANCDCAVSYDPGNGAKKIQDVWSKTWKNDDRIERIKQYSIAKQSKSGKILTGARITDPDSQEARKWAEAYYEEIRHKSTDYIKVADRTGITVEQAKAIKQYLFIDKNLYDEDLAIWVRFDEDPAIAQSWQRLAEGKEILPHDQTLINHELLEMKIKEENPNISHDKAHEMAQSVYNYKKEVREYYGNLNKSKKNK